MAGELILPPYLYPSEVELELADEVGQFHPKAGYATSQRVDYGATRWRGTLRFEKLRTSERHELLAFVARAGRSKGFLTPVYGEELRGIGSYFTELLNPTNPLFANSISGWTQGAETALTESGRIVRATRTGVVGTETMFVNNTITGLVAAGAVGFPHVHRTLLLPGRNAAFFTLSLRQGVTQTGSEYGAVTTTYGYQYNAFVPTSTSLGCQVRDTGFSSLSVGDYFETALFSASRCGVITTSGQTGGNLYTGGWPSSISNLLRAGDFVNVHLPNGLHLGRLVAALHTTSGGLGYLQIAPGLPEAVPSSTAIIPYLPLLKCAVVEIPKVRTYPPGFISDIELSIEGVFG